jgi:UDP-N-acetylglucosamine--dolichyl-phosphate N-acetylglucosaminephosphotransferase
MIAEISIAILQVLIAFFVCLWLTKRWIVLARARGFVGKDMNKPHKPVVAEGGGIAVVISIVFSLFLYIFFKTFVLKTQSHIIEILAFIITLLLACFIGFVDDILGWKKGLSGGKKILLTIPIAIPLAVINAGHSTMHIPLIGSIDFGLIYPLILVPLAIIGTTNGFNLLAGYNGLEAGLGAIIFASFAVAFLLTMQPWLLLISAIILACLLSFLVFNKYPAKVFPGNCFTLSIGSAIGAFAILGNIERFALILFIPFIIEGILKARSKFKAENFARQSSLGLTKPYKKIYSLTHAALAILNRIKRKTTELDVVLSLYAFQLLFVLLAFLSLLA